MFECQCIEYGRYLCWIQAKIKGETGKLQWNLWDVDPWKRCLSMKLFGPVSQQVHPLGDKLGLTFIKYITTDRNMDNN